MNPPISSEADLFSNSALLTERFGGWPCFHDAEVLRVEMSRVNDVVLSMDVYVFRYSNETDASGRLKLKDPTVVKLEFGNVVNMQFENFNEQNVLGDLVCERREDGSIAVEIVSLYGLSGEFSCEHARVAAVYPKDTSEDPAADW
jgi:hypothetical protein